MADYYLAEISSQNDYYPFGMTMPGREFSGSDYRYGFNGKEKDDEVKGVGNCLNYGDRQYDPRIGRWTNIDPLINKYPFISPYHALGNNPIFLTDKQGRENIIYLVLLPSSGTFLSKQDKSDIVKKANANFEAMGLKTRVVPFKGTDFNPKYMDPTDAVAVVGSKSDVVTYVNDKLKNPAFARAVALEYSRGASEVSENVIGPKGGEIITIASETFYQDHTLMKSSKAEYGAFLISHGAGHNSGWNHNGLNADIMKDGGLVTGLINPGTEVGTEQYGSIKIPPNANFQTLRDFITKDGNTSYAESMKKRFSNNTARDDYNSNKEIMSSPVPAPVSPDIQGAPKK